MRMQDRIDGYVRNTPKKSRTSVFWWVETYAVTPAQRRNLAKKRNRLLKQADSCGFEV